MPDILIRNISPERLAFWKRRAAAHGRSLQAELDLLLKEHEEREEQKDRFIEFTERTRRETSKIPQTDSAELIREDRDTDHGRDA